MIRNIEITEKAIQKLNSGEKVNFIELPAGVTSNEFKIALDGIKDKLSKDVVIIWMVGKLKVLQLNLNDLHLLKARIDNEIKTRENIILGIKKSSSK